MYRLHGFPRDPFGYGGPFGLSDTHQLYPRLYRQIRNPSWRASTGTVGWNEQRLLASTSRCLQIVSVRSVSSRSKIGTSQDAIEATSTTQSVVPGVEHGTNKQLFDDEGPDPSYKKLRVPSEECDALRGSEEELCLDEQIHTEGARGKATDRATKLSNNPRKETYQAESQAQDQIIRETFKTKVIRHKLDLSHINFRKHEVQQSDGRFKNTEKVAFHRNGHLRQTLWRYIQHVQPLLPAFADIPDAPTTRNVDEALRKVFGDWQTYNLRRRGFDVEDIMSWSWVLTAKSASQGVRRFVVLSQDLRRQNLQSVPWFVCLQLLRLPHIDSRGLQLLWREVMHTDFNGKSDLDDDSIAIFLIRIIRHARMVDVRLYEEISKALPQLLPNRTLNRDDPDDIEHLRRLTHFYNRFLTLIALPVPVHPFASVPIQQRAQLHIAQFMHETRPQIPITREGYRAFIKLQLRHGKTEGERDWALAKGPNWPPWRRDQLGIQESLEYPGQRSRVMKVLQRMREAGYAPSEGEFSAQILAGWDTDMSPTIQVRRLMNTRPMAWLKNVFTTKDVPEKIDHGIWAARVEATRSVREAWLSFSSYMDATQHSQRNMVVYHVMFNKLLAKAYERDSAIPGDGREVYPDPVASRDRVYVPTEPPSIDELYAQMLDDGIRPAGRLLANLIDGAKSIPQGLSYLENSTLDELKIDVLRHAEKYPASFIHDKLASIPNYLFASFIDLLVRRSPIEDRIMKWPSLLTSGADFHDNRSIDSSTYAMQMLLLSETTHLPTYNAFLEGIRHQIILIQRGLTIPKFSSKRQITKLWLNLLRVVDAMDKNGVAASMVTFRKCAMVIQHLILLAPRLFQSGSSPLTSAPDVIKSIFMLVLTGPATSDKSWREDMKPLDLSLVSARNLRLDQLPQCKDIELLFFICAISQDSKTAMDLLQWMNEGKDALDLQKFGERSQKQMMAAARIALESKWLGQRRGQAETLDQDQVAKIRLWAESFTWAEDEDVEEFMQLRERWFSLASHSVEMVS